MTTKMKAIQLNEYGPSSALRYEDVQRPVAGSGQVLVRVAAAGVNPIDWKFRAGYLKDMIPLALPWTPGFDFSGTVEAVGPDVTGLAVGDAVFGKSAFPGGGSYAQFVVVTPAEIVRKPAGVDHVHAAAIPAGALTAWQALFNDGALELAAGQTLLILGAGGSVGGFAVQLAKRKGARVIAAGRASQQAHLTALGADVFIDTALKNLSLAGQVDAVLDLVGGELQEQAWPQLKQGGAFVSTISPPSADQAATRGARITLVFTQTSAEQLAAVAKLVDQGAVKVQIAKTLPLEKAAEAHALLEAQGVSGKVVLTT
ncbi:NADP-dependent oxidoreductase [Ralstonia pseudosolanacearum]|uniref:NADP-dependent oxidoreductase n=1 Tax=Ralstonia pseudosolanacearum TaxID=1310165 RepID=UPI002234C4EF|nr:NADP-dependent oxidoreductase [Ralstonia sp. RS642]UZF23896.1 NADP-dependent oxidoreductase [Ralstonia sp. RS642]